MKIIAVISALLCLPSAFAFSPQHVARKAFVQPPLRMSDKQDSSETNLSGDDGALSSEDRRDALGKLVGAATVAAGFTQLPTNVALAEDATAEKNVRDLRQFFARGTRVGQKVSLHYLFWNPQVGDAQFKVFQANQVRLQGKTIDTPIGSFEFDAEIILNSQPGSCTVILHGSGIDRNARIIQNRYWAEVYFNFSGTNYQLNIWQDQDTTVGQAPGSGVLGNFWTYPKGKGGELPALGTALPGPPRPSRDSGDWPPKLNKP